MTIQQLEYIVAVDKYRHFVKASKACEITQSTLSSMIQKLEYELNITIFDRNVHPIKPTKIGINVINQAKIILHNFNQLKEMVLSEREQTIGKIDLGIIPTIAPYILPKLFEELKIKYPGLKIHVSEIRTNEIIENLKKAELDMAILATPLEIDDLFEIPLYYEKFVAYVSPSEPLYNITEINPSEMPTKHMWLLQEGHCLRKQIFNFCEKKSDYSSIYEAGSIDTLVKIVDKNGGYTIIPELHIELLDKLQQQNIRQFSSPQPMREISLVVRQDYVREKILNIIAEAIKTIIPEHMIDSRLKKFAIKL